MEDVPRNGTSSALSIYSPGAPGGPKFCRVGAKTAIFAPTGPNNYRVGAPCFQTSVRELLWLGQRGYEGRRAGWLGGPRRRQARAGASARLSPESCSSGGTRVLRSEAEQVPAFPLKGGCRVSDRGLEKRMLRKTKKVRRQPDFSFCGA